METLPKFKEQADDLRRMASECIDRSAESFERCDTDGFMSQWANDVMARVYQARARIMDNNGLGEVRGLYEGDRRVKAMIINGQYGECWMLHEDEVDLIARRNKRFLPVGSKSRILKQLGLSQRLELAPAWATSKGHNGIEVFRTGDKWGQDAQLKK